MAQSLTIEAALDAWLADVADMRSVQTYKSYEYALRSFRSWLQVHASDATLAMLDVALLRAYVQSLLNRHLDARTLHQYVGVVTRWLQALADGGEVAGIPNQRGKLLTPAGVRTVLEQLLPRLQPAVAPHVPDLRRLPLYYHEQLQATPPPAPGAKPSEQRGWLNLLRNRALVVTLFSTGGRVNEILSIDVKLVRRNGQVGDTVRITGKGRKQRPVHLNAAARRWLGEYLIARDPYFPGAKALFISHGPRGKGERLSDVSAWKIVKEAAEALAEIRSVEGAEPEEIKALLAVSPHSLRHFLAQAMLDEGADYKDLTAVLGHSSAVVTEQFYARLGDERVMEIVETFAPEPAAAFRSSDERTE